MMGRKKHKAEEIGATNQEVGPAASRHHLHDRPPFARSRLHTTTMSPSSSSKPEESLPLLSPQPHHSPTLRSKLSARRHVPISEKAKGKQRAVESDSEAQPLIGDDIEDDDEAEEKEKEKGKKVQRGRLVTVIFSNEEKEGNLELWVEPDETVGKVKDQVCCPPFTFEA